MKKKMKIPGVELPAPVRNRIIAADGYLDLKLCRFAREELDGVAEEFRDSALWLAVRRRLAAETADWAEAVRVGARLCEKEPGEPGHWVMYAFATRRAESLEQARLILADARTRFPREAILAYNLACYECRLTRLDSARSLLRETFQLDPAFRDIALRDADLSELRQELAVL